MGDKISLNYYNPHVSPFDGSPTMVLYALWCGTGGIIFSAAMMVMVDEVTVGIGTGKTDMHEAILFLSFPLSISGGAWALSFASPSLKVSEYMTPEFILLVNFAFPLGAFMALAGTLMAIESYFSRPNEGEVKEQEGAVEMEIVVDGEISVAPTPMV